MSKISTVLGTIASVITILEFIIWLFGGGFVKTSAPGSTMVSLSMETRAFVFALLEIGLLAVVMFGNYFLFVFCREILGSKGLGRLILAFSSLLFLIFFWYGSVVNTKIFLEQSLMGWFSSSEFGPFIGFWTVLGSLVYFVCWVAIPFDL